MPPGVPVTSEEVGRDAGTELWSECGAAPGVGTAYHAWLWHGHGVGTTAVLCAMAAGAQCPAPALGRSGWLAAGLCHMLCWPGSQMSLGLLLGARPHCSEAHIPAAAFGVAQCCGTCWSGWQSHGDPSTVSPAQGGKHGGGWRSVELCNEAEPGLPTGPQGHRDMVSSGDRRDAEPSLLA